MDTRNSESSAKNQQLALVLIGVLAVMLIPMPPAILDALLTINITVSLLIVMTVLNTSRPMDFSTFPSILLFTALFRLSLNVASTRLILLHGEAGSIIEAFGKFVIGGNYVVGIIIFLILVIIQFVVITKGQNRISEVTARFTLDALPGKQMSIDADLNAGLISNEEAKERRAELTKEAQFYGSMDGAGKFVRGDAIAGLIITAINIIGGLGLGVFVNGMTVSEAFDTFTRLTVGDGLVSQLPGLLISIAAGILTAKGSSDQGLGNEMSDQLLTRPVALRTVAGILLVISLLPGMPTIPFMMASFLMFYLSRKQGTSLAAEKQAEAMEQAELEKGPEEPSLEDLLTVDRLSIEIGYRLISLVDPGKDGGLLDHIRALRRQFASSLGILIPPIRVKDNIQIDPNGYQIMLNGQKVAVGELRAGNYLAMDPGGIAGDIDGIETVEPAFGLPAHWISLAEKDKAELQGYTVIDAPSVLVTHLTEVIRSIASELLSRDDVKALVENLKKSSPAIVEEVIPSQLTLGQLQIVLSKLLKERVPIRNLHTILQSLADSVGETKDPRVLVEMVRTGLARTILEPHLDDDGTLHAVVLDPQLEKSLADAVAGTDGLSNLPSGFLAKFVDSTAEALAGMVQEGRDPVLITRSTLRPFLSEAVASVIPNASVLSYQETSPATKVETITRVSVLE